MYLETLLLVASSLILFSAVLARVSNNLGVPTIVLFLGIGLLAGPEGFGKLQLADIESARIVGTIALALILFSGGLDTSWPSVRQAVNPALRLATIGVLLTALIVAACAYLTGLLSFEESLLLGAVISSTDAAAVFSVLRTRGINLKGRLGPLLELESGLNDPTAVFLTVTLVELALAPNQPLLPLAASFVLQMGIGSVIGLVLGRGLVYVMNHLRSPFEGLYPVIVLAAALFVFSFASLLGGSGFLAVYLAGMVLGNHDFIQRQGILRFFDGLAWLSEIVMFVLFGLLASLSELFAVAPIGLAVAAALTLVARPLAVFLTVPERSFSVRDKLLVSWVGLRGAVPIVLAIFPLLAGVPAGSLIFNVVFFVVLSSTLIQGWTVAPAARLLGLSAPLVVRGGAIGFSPQQHSEKRVLHLTVPEQGVVVGQQLVDLQLPAGTLLVLISRGEEYVVPTGSTVFEGGDRVEILTSLSDQAEIEALFTARRSE